MTYHFREPPALVRFNVVIHEGEDRASGFRRAAITEPTKVKLAGIAQDTGDFFLFQHAQELQCLGVGRSIIDNDNFNAEIVGLLANAFDAALEQRHVVASWNHDRNKGRRIPHFINDPVRLRIFRARNNSGLHAAAFQRICDGPPGCFFRVRFCVRDRGEATLGHPPVIENARNMPYLIRSQRLDAAQRKIVVL